MHPLFLLPRPMGEGWGEGQRHPSGTEPKIKFYMFAQCLPAPGSRFTAAQLAEIKAGVKSSIDAVWEWAQKDAAQRLGL